MKVWVFAGGGQAELGVIQFLEKHFPGVLFERRMPQRNKPGPRPNLPNISYGATGKDLQTRIKSNLTNYWDSSVSLLLLLDDLDCDQRGAKTTALLNAAEEGIKAGQEGVAVPTVIDTVVALAVPELEAWLLGDWKNTFEKKYRNCHSAMRHDLVAQGIDFAHVEAFDSRCETDEYRKISVVLKETFDKHCSGGKIHYSKDTDTRQLLMEVDPAETSKSCPIFREFWNELNRLLAPRP